MRFLILTLYSLTITAHAYASEEIRWRQFDNGNLEFWSLHTEPGQMCSSDFKRDWENSRT